ncbi:hypothetical protein F5Y16DRAFT_2607 [Xylariaceae sp. FL0255]|nr:hypothetical protein F5Y16DRAFT_2607 [Xylariaceae sp. FL0255]
MAIFNPLKFLVFPFVFLVAFPLAICAGVTTVLAFLVLFLRLFLVHFDVGLETLLYAFRGHKPQRTTPSSPISLTNSPILSGSPETTAATLRHQRRKKRRGSFSGGSITPIGRSGSSLSLAPSVGLERDFEGVGGWRLDSIDLDTSPPPNEEQWYTLNSRLDVPSRQRHHFRSQSGGAVLTGVGLFTKSKSINGSYSPESTMKTTSSPSRSRSRTPTINRTHAFTKVDQDEYFPPYDGKPLRKIAAV